MLEYFIALAENGSFTDAANACYVSQPALSRAIAGLEKEIDCVLVDRENRKTVKLTPAGEMLLTESKRILRQMDIMRERVKQVERQTRRRISMGYIAYGILRDFRRECAQAIQSLQQQDLWIESVYGATPELRERVLSGELDCALLVESTTYDMPGCRVIPAYESERRIMISRKHPLFERNSVRLEELRDSSFVFFDPGDLPLLYAANVEACRMAGFTPKVVGFGHKAGDVAELVQQHGAVAMMSTAFDYAQTDDLKLIPIENEFIKENRTVYALVMLERPINPAMTHVIEAFQAKIQPATC